MVSQGADVASRNNDGWSPLQSGNALKNNFVLFIFFHIREVLFEASERGNYEIVKYLAENGADVNNRTKNLVTPIQTGKVS